MSDRPIPCVFRDDAFHPLPAFLKAAHEAYGEGEVINLVAVEDRSSKTHRHYFSVINEVWKSLSEEQLKEFPTADALRKKALIQVGWRDAATFVCSSRAEAVRFAAFLRPIDDEAIVSLAGSTVMRLTAKSQSMRAQSKESFADTKERVFNVLAELIGTDPTTLRNLKEAA